MIKYIGLAIGLILLIIQFVSTGVDNPPVTGELTAPKAVTQIFERACYDCHSNKTQLKWYDKIAPVSWKVSKDVREARSRFNFSEWDQLTPMERQTVLWHTVNAVAAGKMPLKSYTAVHPSAKVSVAEIEILKSYVRSLPNIKVTEVTASAYPDTALNGVKYITDYRKWQVISTTNRFDNNTIRVVYGNDITVKAIKENNIHPFPNGAAIAKVVWNKTEDQNGNIRPGTFNAVQIMTKDDAKYKETGGWGFAIFSGLPLKPFGKTITYQNTCFNCHKQLASENGYVFNVPPANKSMFDAGNQQLITSFANKTTMSVLYGNKAKSVFTLATWEQLDHPQWYGSHINGRLKTVETLQLPFDYKVIKGIPPQNIRERINFIVHQQASVFP